METKIADVLFAHSRDFRAVLLFGKLFTAGPYNWTAGPFRLQSLSFGFRVRMLEHSGCALLIVFVQGSLVFRSHSGAAVAW